MLEDCPGSPSTNYVPETQTQKRNESEREGLQLAPRPGTSGAHPGQTSLCPGKQLAPHVAGAPPQGSCTFTQLFPGLVFRHWEHLITVYLCFLSSNTFIKEIMFLSLWDKTQINLEDSGLISWFIALLTSWMFFNTSFFKRNYENHIYYAGSLKMFLEKYQNKNRILKPNIFSIFHGTSFKLPCLVILNKITLILV